MVTVLVLEDNADSRFVLRTALEKRGFDVFEAADQEQALKIAEEFHVDLLIADVILRSEAGPATARRLNELCPGMPVLYVSGYPLSTLLNRAMLQPDDLGPKRAFLGKPFSLTALFNKISGLLR